MHAADQPVKETSGGGGGAPIRGPDFEAYLLAELNHLADSLLRNEEDGERRVTFFMTLTGAAVAALGLVLREGVASKAAHAVAAGALLVLLLLGRLTFLRIVQRNRVSDEYRRALSRVRSYFLMGRGDPRLAFVPFDPYGRGGRKRYRTRSLRNGGWMETVAALNGLLLTGFVLVITNALLEVSLGGEESPLTWLVAGGVGILAGILGWRYQLHDANRRLGLEGEAESGRAGHEIEIALVIVGREPGGVANEVAALESLGGVKLEAAPTRRIRDVYFDAADERLHRAGLALRLREVDGEPWVTVKGQERRRADGTVERLEIEGPWSPAVLHRVLEVLRSHGCFHGVRPPQSASVSPLDGIRSLGLTVIQDRTTRRRPRRILGGRGQAGPIGELAIDEVEYEVGGQLVRIHEIELEARSEAGEAMVGALAGALVEAFSPRLRRWPHSKLATGRALEQLATEQVLDGVIGPGADVLPAGWDLLAVRLSESRG
jgi:hypothetical protein